MQSWLAFYNSISFYLLPKNILRQNCFRKSSGSTRIVCSWNYFWTKKSFPKVLESFDLLLLENFSRQKCLRRSYGIVRIASSGNYSKKSTLQNSWKCSKYFFWKNFEHKIAFEKALEFFDFLFLEITWDKIFFQRLWELSFPKIRSKYKQ